MIRIVLEFDHEGYEHLRLIGALAVHFRAFRDNTVGRPEYED